MYHFQWNHPPTYPLPTPRIHPHPHPSLPRLFISNEREDNTETVGITHLDAALHCAFSSDQILHKMSLTLFKVITFSRSECHGTAQLLSWQIQPFWQAPLQVSPTQPITACTTSSAHRQPQSSGHPEKNSTWELTQRAGLCFHKQHEGRHAVGCKSTQHSNYLGWIIEIYWAQKQLTSFS